MVGHQYPSTTHVAVRRSGGEARAGLIIAFASEDRHEVVFAQAAQSHLDTTRLDGCEFFG